MQNFQLNNGGETEQRLAEISENLDQLLHMVRSILWFLNRVDKMAQDFMQLILNIKRVMTYSAIEIMIMLCVTKLIY